MKILHGTWIPENTQAFIQSGQFYLWVESSEQRQRSQQDPKEEASIPPIKLHPRQPSPQDILHWFKDDIGLKTIAPSPSAQRLSPSKSSKPGSPQDNLTPIYFWLPSSEQQPLPSPELSHYLEQQWEDDYQLQCWQIHGFPLVNFGLTYNPHSLTAAELIKLLSDLNFLACCQPQQWQLGSDLVFWYQYTQALCQVLAEDAYIPILKYQTITAEKSNSKRRSTTNRRGSSTPSVSKSGIVGGWELVSRNYRDLTASYAPAMPAICTVGFEAPLWRGSSLQPQYWEASSLLQHFDHCLLTNLVATTPFPITFKNKLEDTLLETCTSFLNQLSYIHSSDEHLKCYQQWQPWYDRLRRQPTDRQFYLYFHLKEPDFDLDEAADTEESWLLEFQMTPKSDPSLRLALFDYWYASPARQMSLEKTFGEELQNQLLTELSLAAQIYPKLWSALNTNAPTHVTLTLDEAFEFLQETAWIVQEAGYRVVVPAWWTPEGQRRAKLKLRASSRGNSSESQGYLSMANLVDYHYELTIGDEQVSEVEWQELLAAKTPLVHFRGQWMQLDRSRMQEMMAFWQAQQGKTTSLSLLDLLRMSANSDTTDVEVDFHRDHLLREMIQRLNQPSELAIQPQPPNLKATLREYQQRGLAWIQYLDSLGLNGCLADDMGLGKTMQVIARLLQEREEQPDLSPTLLVVPTSVIGNWLKELERFAPSLTALIHHGPQRLRDPEEFVGVVTRHDVVITSFTLVRKDLELLERVAWHRVVLDEAQNIKNPKTAQTRAVLKLEAHHRLALTGTPVENRLMDLWSIFNFLNPGYLGKQSQFRSQFETPIQKNNDRTRAATLKKLVEPFILRRVKTDKNIIKDLPDKVEQKCYCNLTKEQASLYGAVVKDVERAIELVDGMKRKGLILSTLMKLKQICNHPRQFLQDSSEFTPERSHKLERLTEMVEEVMAEGESLLIFTQFTEIGDCLQQYFHNTCHYNTYYLHGGTLRQKRERMIQEFQDPNTEPSVFILSLKAGGVGITLTKANHVFHFDRWWNPAVEDQATDRAFRIGQNKNVFVHKFLALGTLEEKIDQMIEDKKSLAGAIVGADESWLTELDNESFKQLIALNRNALWD